jgi:uncharacterized membrane protein YidH (DUF202 family)
MKGKAQVMNNLNHYQREMKAIAQDAGKTKGKGHGVAWLMMIVGVVVTGTMTYSLTRKGMADSSLWREWVTVAALLPTVLLEGSALALVYGRHHWFRSEEQRSIANTAGWVIWILLAMTSVVHFACAPGRAHSLGGESPLRTRQGESLAERQGCPSRGGIWRKP